MGRSPSPLLDDDVDMHREGLPVPRFAMSLFSLAPLFLLLILRGDRNHVLPQHCLELICGGLIVLPALFLCRRFQIVRKNKQTHSLTLGKNEDRSIHVLAYLLMIRGLLLLYSDSRIRP